MSAPLPYGVRTRIAGTRALSEGRKMFAESRAPSRIGIAICRYLTTGLGAAQVDAVHVDAAQAKPAHEAKISHQARLVIPNTACPLAPHHGERECVRLPAGRSPRPPQTPMLAEP